MHPVTKMYNSGGSLTIIVLPTFLPQDLQQLHQYNFDSRRIQVLLIARLTLDSYMYISLPELKYICIGFALFESTFMV